MSILLLIIFSIHIPVDSWQSEILEERQVRGVPITNFPSIRPFDVDPSVLLDTVIHALPLLNLSCDGLYDTVKTLRLRPVLHYEWARFTLLVEPVMKFGKDSLPPSQVFMELFSADYERAYVKVDLPHFQAFVGRERISIGPSPRHNLILSGRSMPMDWLSGSVFSEKLRLSFFITRLEDMYTKPLAYEGDTITEYIIARRFLSVKRLDYSPAPWLNFGISESAIFGGEGYALEFYHFNPVVFLQAYQYNWNKDVNFFLLFDAKVYRRNLCLYGQLLLDDFQLEKDPNNEPNHLGFNAGIEAVDLFGLRKIFWLLEYTAVTRYTYCHFIPYQRYQYRDTPIGSPRGCDFDELHLKLVYHFLKRLDIYSSGTYLRKGENRIHSLWPIPESPRVTGTAFPDENFLSGTVQHSFTGIFGVRMIHNSWLRWDLSVGMTRIIDQGHEQGASTSGFFLAVGVKIIDL